MCHFVPFRTFDPLQQSIDLLRHMLAENLDHSPFLVSEVVLLRHRLGGMPDISVHEIRVPTFVDGMLHRVGLERVSKILGGDIALGVPVQERALEEFSVSVVVPLVWDDGSDSLSHPLEVVIHHSGEWNSPDSVLVLHPLAKFGVVLDGEGALQQVHIRPAQSKRLSELQTADTLK
ncbi:MAG: hypothetical protein HDKAJFGB_02284 [Anaerolineae bacterium]|nr:hypothetical protein [Anaerolineae bacterium]